jgi:hypothetical protein
VSSSCVFLVSSWDWSLDCSAAIWWNTWVNQAATPARTSSRLCFWVQGQRV